MFRKIQRQRIAIRDSERKSLHDSFSGPGRSGIFRPKTNRVIIEARDPRSGKKEVVGNSTNLIVYHGRSWLMQRAFGLNLGAVGNSPLPKPWDHNDDTSVTDVHRNKWSNMYLCWFAAGQGGADTTNAPLEPYDTTSVEYQLLDHVPIGGLDENPSGTTDNLRYIHPAFFEGGPTRDYHEIDSQYPQFLFDPDIVPGEGGTEDPLYLKMETTDSTSEVYYGGFKADSYLRALIRVTLAPEECNGPKYYDPMDPGEEYRYLNEAGLFVARSHDATTVKGYPEGYNELQMFAKVNFSSIRKDDTRELIFSWYVYF